MHIEGKLDPELIALQVVVRKLFEDMVSAADDPAFYRAHVKEHCVEAMETGKITTTGRIDAENLRTATIAAIARLLG